jgi:hypothetical protein
MGTCHELLKFTPRTLLSFYSGAKEKNGLRTLRNLENVRVD